MTAPPTENSRAFFHPGGFAKLDAPPPAETERVRWLTAVFARIQLRSMTAKLMAVSFPLTALAGAAFIALMMRIEQLGNLLGDDRRVFVTDKALPILFASNVVNAILQTTIWVAPGIARDVRSGALLLYFSRPLRRRDYLLARFLAAALVLFAELGGSALLLVLTMAITFGVHLDGQSALAGLTFWILLALGELLISAVIAAGLAILALGCSAVAKTTNGAPLLFAGLFMGSIPLALVLGSVAGGGPVWQAVNLYSGGLHATHELMLALLSPQPMPDGLLIRALVGLTIWAGLAYGSWQLLVRLLRHPPVGKGRA